MSVPAAPAPLEAGASSAGGELVSSFTFFMFSCKHHTNFFGKTGTGHGEEHESYTSRTENNTTA